MKNGNSVYDDLYRRMDERPNNEMIHKIFGYMGEYIKFYGEWINICSAINKSDSNPNVRLRKRWNE